MNLDENELDKSELRRKCTRRNVTEPLKKSANILPVKLREKMAAYKQTFRK